MSNTITFSLGEGCGSRVYRVDLDIFSPEEIERIAVVEVTESTLYNKNIPLENGPNDNRMGPGQRMIACGTCGNYLDKCPGHYGFIKLAHPIYHISNIDTVRKILCLVCCCCCKPLFSFKVKKYLDIIKSTKGLKRLAALYTAFIKPNKRSSCINPTCGWPQPLYKKCEGVRIDADYSSVHFSTQEEKNWAQRPFTSRDAHNILKHVDDFTYRVFGFKPKRTRPDWMIMTNLLVPPNAIRPAIAESEGSRTRGQDDLTRKIQEIVKANNEIIKEIDDLSLKGVTDENLLQTTSELTKLAKLQLIIAAYMDNDISGVKPTMQRSGQPTKCIIERLKGKNGRIRGNLQGKRV
jgi:DNA-directed RNA polymerase II subunit RPB1